MKLFYKPGACSVAPHIVMRECDFDFTLVRVDTATGVTERGEPWLEINPRGQVPALMFDDGTLLTEVAAITQYLADLKPDRQLLAEAGSLTRYQTLEWLSYLSSEIHKRFAPLFRKEAADAYKSLLKLQLNQRFIDISNQLGDKPWLQGSRFTLADCYLYPIWRWATALKIAREETDALQAWAARVEARPTVQAVLQAEGIEPLTGDERRPQ
ncbi:glutathione transferase GstA [Duffyella gerundensis]|uniref:glutathione transferase GstA n=1 Tax=Duffyella gerundensis TaxID=1619313 RepID=UPI001AE2A1BF|nr:glutathione transferase GstA [Duffyella gerundensis]QTO55895.1 glutathione transferase GstA [Duffyella gerundensis]